MTADRTPMTADELAAELYRRQGYLVLQHSDNTLKPGDLLPGIYDSRIGDSDTVLRVIGPATLQQAVRQDNLSKQIHGEWEAFGDMELITESLYLVEAAD